MCYLYLDFLYIFIISLVKLNRKFVTPRDKKEFFIEKNLQTSKHSYTRV